MGTRDLIAVDRNTGEQLEGFPVFVPRRTSVPGSFVMMWQNSFAELAQNPNLQGNDLRVLLYIIGKLDFENYVTISQKDVSHALGIAKQHVSNTCKKLVREKILTEGPRLGHSKTYRLNTFYGWKGRVKNMDKVEAV